ncbi:Lysine acetyltransferase, partial [Frankliniella fusca]
MDVTATLQRPEIQAIVNKITSVPSRTNHCLAFWVNTNISESVSNRPRPTPPPDHDDMATFQAPLVNGEDVEAYFARLENALQNSNNGNSNNGNHNNFNGHSNNYNGCGSSSTSSHCCCPRWT